MINANRLLVLIAKNCLTVQVGRLDGTVVVTSNEDNRVYCSEVYFFDTNSKVKAIGKAVMGAIQQINELKKGVE